MAKPLIRVRCEFKSRRCDKLPLHTIISSMTCESCNSDLTGRQRRFCSARCRNQDSNRRNQSYQAQQIRGKTRKESFILERGGGCERCGYNRCTAALEFHHIDKIAKRFTLDLRSLSNRTLSACEEELKKCILLCANCHRECHTS